MNKSVMISFLEINCRTFRRVGGFGNEFVIFHDRHSVAQLEQARTHDALAGFNPVSMLTKSPRAPPERMNCWRMKVQPGRSSGFAFLD